MKKQIFALSVLLVLLLANDLFAIPDLKLPFRGGESWILTCGYGCGFHTSENNGYYAIDFDKTVIAEDQKPGEPVLSPIGGTVIFSGLDGSFGYSVKIDDGNGYVVRIAHFRDTPIVSVNEQVSQGQPLGIMGRTGKDGEKVYKDHIHFQVYHNGINVKPEPMSGYTNFTVGISYLSTNYFSPQTHFNFADKNPQGWTCGYDCEVPAQNQTDPNTFRIAADDFDASGEANPGFVSPTFGAKINTAKFCIQARHLTNLIFFVKV